MLEGIESGVGTWPAYRMWDCYWQMRHPDVQYTSDAVTLVRGRADQVLQAERGQMFPEDVAQLARWL